MQDNLITGDRWGLSRQSVEPKARRCHDLRGQDLLVELHTVERCKVQRERAHRPGRDISRSGQLIGDQDPSRLVERDRAKPGRKSQQLRAVRVDGRRRSGQRSYNIAGRDPHNPLRQYEGDGSGNRAAVGYGIVVCDLHSSRGRDHDQPAC